MPTWTKLVPTDHQAAIFGKVIDAVTRRPIAGVRVEITEMPAAFQRWLSLRKLPHDDWESLPERPDRTRTSPDGLFHFLDLPDGAYTLSFSQLEAGKRLGKAQRAFSVARDGNERIGASMVTTELTPTGGHGKIVGAASAAVPMALVRVAGSGEETYSGSDGGYALTFLEPGARSLAISAPGFLTTTTTVTLVEGAMASLGETALSPK